MDISELAFKVPYSLSSAWIDFIQETAAVAPVKNSSETPRLILKWLYVHYLDKQNISRLCAFNLKGAGKIMNLLPNIGWHNTFERISVSGGVPSLDQHSSCHLHCRCFQFGHQSSLRTQS